MNVKAQNLKKMMSSQSQKNVYGKKINKFMTKKYIQQPLCKQNSLKKQYIQKQTVTDLT